MMDLFGFITITIIWFVLFSLLFLDAKQHGSKYLAQGFACLILATPIWPIAFLVIISWLFYGFLKEVIKSATEIFKEKNGHK